nr:class C sortase [Leucobacter edaphi]
MTIAITVVALAGLVTILYPGISSWISQYNQSRNIIDYADAVSSETPAHLLEARRLAHEYNAGITGTAVVGAHKNTPSSTPENPDDRHRLDYDHLLRFDSQGLMGRLQIPGIDLDLPIYHGTSEATLLAGVGHLEGTALPVGGEGTRSVLTAHRGLASATLFTRLDEVGEDDTFTLTVAGEVLTYRVTKVQVVAPEDTETLLPKRGKDLVTLITCTPLGVNTHRILVTGERVEPTPQDALDAASHKPDVPRFPWWAVALGAGLLAIGAYGSTDGLQRPRAAGARDRAAA